MNDLFSKWKTKIPKYSEEFRDTLFESLSRKFGGSEKVKVNLGKHFSNNYELYIYAFFLGIYSNEYVPIPEGSKKVDFSHAIQFWGSKTNAIGRKDFTSIQEYIFAALVAKTDLSFVELEKGELTEEAAIKALISTMEAYTNGGLNLIKERLDDNPNYFLQPTAFLNMIMEKPIIEN